MCSRYEWQQQPRLPVERDRLRRLLAELRVASTRRSDHEPLDVIDDEAVIQADAVQRRLGAVDHAPDGIDSGGYGGCMACGSEIVTERLDALPTAADSRDRAA